jgi:SAM-dependent methyltransferase
MSEHEHFQRAYSDRTTPPWDIGRPQPALMEAQRRGWIRGSVLDAGCGTGEHSLHFAAAGCDVVGVDVVPAAIERAVAKAAQPGLANPPHFVVADVIREPAALGDRTFDTVVDMGFFHTLTDEQRTAWRSVLAHVLVAGGSYVMVCFSDLVPGGYGPRRISEAEIRDTFRHSDGFEVAELERAEIESNRGAAVVAIPAWLTKIDRR